MTQLVEKAAQLPDAAANPMDALTALITVQTLLFATFSVAAAFAITTKFGQPLRTSVGTFATAVSVVITVVGLSALVVGWQVFFGSSSVPFWSYIAAFGIGVGVLAEIAFSWWVSDSLRQGDH